MPKPTNHIPSWQRHPWRQQPPFPGVFSLLGNSWHQSAMRWFFSILGGKKKKEEEFGSKDPGQHLGVFVMNCEAFLKGFHHEGNARSLQALFFCGRCAPKNAMNDGDGTKCHSRVEHFTDPQRLLISHCFLCIQKTLRGTNLVDIWIMADLLSPFVHQSLCWLRKTIVSCRLIKGVQVKWLRREKKLDHQGREFIGLRLKSLNCNPV